MEISPQQSKIIAATEKDWKGIIAKSNALLEKGDIAGLEAYAGELQKHRATLYGRYHPLEKFYRALRPTDKMKEAQWQARKELLDRWLEAHPESVAARTALMNWWIGYAWLARGTGWGNEVTEDGWRLMKERLHEARKQFDAVMERGNRVDVVFYNIAIAIGLGQGWSLDEVTRCLDLSREIDSNYGSIYGNVANYLAPKWHGEPGDVERFAASAASRFEGDEADYLFATLMTQAVEHGQDGKAFFLRNPDVYDRLKRGLEIALAQERTQTSRDRWASEFCRFVMFAGDPATARTLILEWGVAMPDHAFGGREALLAMRRESGAQAEIDKGIQLEREGKIKEAEALYRSFSTQPVRSYWLPGFYRRQGLIEPFRKLRNYPLFPDVEKASLNDTHAVIYPAAAFGEWELATKAAQKFDAKRPWNLSGLGVLFLDAARTGDKDAAKKLHQSFLERKVNRPALKNAQAILRGDTPWQELARAFHPQDDYNQQAALVVIGWFLSQGDQKQAAEFLEAIIPPEGLKEYSILSDFLNSLRYGSLRGTFFTEAPDSQKSAVESERNS